MGPDGDMSVSEVYGVPEQKIAIPEGGVRNSTRFQPKFEIYNRCHLCSLRGQQSVPHKLTGRWQPLYNTLRKNHHGTKRTQFGNEVEGVYGGPSYLHKMRNTVGP